MAGRTFQARAALAGAPQPSSPVSPPAAPGPGCRTLVENCTALVCLARGPCAPRSPRPLHPPAPNHTTHGHDSSPPPSPPPHYSGTRRLTPTRSLIGSRRRGATPSTRRSSSSPPGPRRLVPTGRRSDWLCCVRGRVSPLQKKIDPAKCARAPRGQARTWEWWWRRRRRQLWLWLRRGTGSSTGAVDCDWWWRCVFFCSSLHDPYILPSLIPSLSKSAAQRPYIIYKMRPRRSARWKL